MTEDAVASCLPQQRFGGWGSGGTWGHGECMLVTGPAAVMFDIRWGYWYNVAVSSLQFAAVFCLVVVAAFVRVVSSSNMEEPPSRTIISPPSLVTLAMFCHVGRLTSILAALLRRKRRTKQMPGVTISRCRAPTAPSAPSMHGYMVLKTMSLACCMVVSLCFTTCTCDRWLKVLAWFFSGWSYLSRWSHSCHSSSGSPHQGDGQAALFRSLRWEGCATGAGEPKRL